MGPKQIFPKYQLPTQNTTMFNTPYTETEEYQKEIADQYKKRIGNFDINDVLEGLQKLGFDVKADDLKTTTAGNMNTTYLTPDIVVKVNKQNIPNFLSNKIVSDRLSDKAPVVKVLAYDYFEKIPFEMLVMKRESGTTLLDDIFELKEDELKELFRQVLHAVKQIFNVKFDTFGWLNLEGKKSYQSFAEFLTYKFKKDAQKIRGEKLCMPEDLDKVEKYFLSHVQVFNTKELPTIVHRDLHMGNFLHDATKLTAIIDFDWSMKGPKIGSLPRLLGFIDNPSQYTEGSPYFEKYKGKNFRFLMPVLKEELKELFDDKDLLKKLSLLFISDGIKWIAENWSQKWNEDMMQAILTKEMPETKNDLQRTYSAQVLS